MTHQIFFLPLHLESQKFTNIQTMKDRRQSVIKGHIVDVVGERVYDGKITITDGHISSITHCSNLDADAPYIMPGFIDSHVHIESSMMLPSEFARISLRHGTIGVVCDPHEIANVLGLDGIQLMLDNACGVPFHFAFGVPSCVPPCTADIVTSGNTIAPQTVAQLLRQDHFCFLSEMMDYPGVLNGDPQVIAKIKAAQAVGKPIDGHAPGLMGEQRLKYAQAGITTDHECSSLEEAREALRAGMKILIREGSAAKNYEALAPLIAESPHSVMFCTDDSHPGDLINGHINKLVIRALQDGYKLMDVLRVACVNPVRHYKLPIGLLQPGDSADFICVTDLTPGMRILETYISGQPHLSDVSGTHYPTTHPQNHITVKNICNAYPITAEDISSKDSQPIHIIVANDGSLLTQHETTGTPDRNLQKIVVYNRYTPGAKPVAAYTRGFDIEYGAFAQTIAHDCHNIIAIGSNDQLLVKVINRVIEFGGGIVATDGTDTIELPLPIAGLLSPLSGEELAKKNLQLETIVRKSGCTMNSPFITLGFMSLPVIPALKLTDKGLFDVEKFEFVT